MPACGLPDPKTNVTIFKVDFIDDFPGSASLTVKSVFVRAYAYLSCASAASAIFQ